MLRSVDEAQEERKRGDGKMDKIKAIWIRKDEQRRGAAQFPKCGANVGNGAAGRRSPLIAPERLKDFGEEELLTGGARLTGATATGATVVVVGGPEITLMQVPKTRRLSEFRVVPRPPVEYLRFQDISDAALRIQTAIQRTPCTYSRLSKQYGMEIYLKKEQLHYTGSVKERGVLNLLTCLPQVREREREDENAAYLAGLGTVGMEIHEQLPKLDAVVVPAAGQYALLAGVAAAIKHLHPQVLVIGIEPDGFPLLSQSLKADGPIKDLHSNPNRKLYGDLVERSLGVNTFQLAKKLVDKVVSVREEDSLVAMLRFQEFERSTVDTEGAMGLAAILAGQLPELRGKRVAVVVSSANMELELVRQCVDRALVLDDRVSKFSVQLGECPGDMARLLDVLSREDVRLLDVCHRRQSEKSDLFKAKVECVVEARDKAQSVQLRKTLSDRYPSICWLDR
ncbi:L-threonine ammonia-lyase [Liparis tanakae]|uniref:L-serine deaminase n=1 Tax=Liparis tanakae TaxID=230148 RepID=A0A4Z2I2V0_9TELE|nr:L-threonine ammonia-lyase [Liparis tanakae]